MVYDEGSVPTLAFAKKLPQALQGTLVPFTMTDTSPKKAQARTSYQENCEIQYVPKSKIQKPPSRQKKPPLVTRTHCTHDIELIQI